MSFGIVLMGIIIYLALPVSSPKTEYSTVINDRYGNLLNASIASDGQWRFPPADSVPHKLATCILLFEDEYFFAHPGINPLALARAIRQNIRAGKIISGASTITMQVARMLERSDRTFLQKIIEIGIALRLEAHHTKDEILNQYMSLAPFGGNVVGINSASWRYYGRPAHLLTWSESAALAVLPNRPGAIYPGRGQLVLRKKRDFLLSKLLSRNFIDSLEYQLALAEPLPGKPLDLPRKASHLLTTISEKYSGTLKTTSIDPFWQERTTEVLERKHQSLKTNGVDNLAALVVDLQDGSVLAYVGNTQDRSADGHQVDIIQRPRSSGSILKPILYASALDEGIILPETMIPDIPSFFGGYSPKNFNLDYEGLVNANDALSRSLNIPFTYLLKDLSYEKFHAQLKKVGITTLNQPPDHYGLTMILGGAEVKLWDLAQAYFGMYRKLANEDNLKISYLNEPTKLKDLPFEEISIWHALKAMTKLQRPDNDKSWKSFSSSQVMAWKTGTSFGFRDAWALGLNGNVLIAVWVGNADGEGRAGLSGAFSAGPILTELIRLAPNHSQWLTDLEPYSIPASVCSKSGMLATPRCPDTKTAQLGSNAQRSGLCNYHQDIWLDESLTYQVNNSCYPSNLMKKTTMFLLPPTQGYYYQKKHSDYIGRPSPYPNCGINHSEVLAINYPKPNAKIYIPKELSGISSELIMEATHQDSDATVYWHINDEYAGSTTNHHKLPISVSKGEYQVTTIDEQGNTSSIRFEVLSELNKNNIEQN